MRIEKPVDGIGFLYAEVLEWLLERLRVFIQKIYGETKDDIGPPSRGRCRVGKGVKCRMRLCLLCIWRCRSCVLYIVNLTSAALFS